MVRVRYGTPLIAAMLGGMAGGTMGCDDAPALPPKAEDTTIVDTSTGDATLEDLVEADVDGPSPGCTIEATLTSLKTSYFKTGCTFSGCHGTSRPSAGLDLSSDGLHARLINVSADDSNANARGKKLVVPGDAENSFLYQKVAATHERDEGFLMPDGADTPVDVGCRIYQLRKWIDDGALDN